VQINPKIPGKLSILAEGELGSPRVSANGQVEVWDQVVPTGESIMRWQDGQTQNISNDPHSSIFPVPSRTGDVVAYTQFNSLDLSDPNGRWEIHQWRDGKTSLVAKSDKGNLYDPAVSGDGRVLAWDNDGDGRMVAWNIQRQPVGGPVEDVTSGPNEASDPRLDYFGRRVIFSDGRTGQSQVWIADGHQPPHAVAPSKGTQANASISPLGGMVMYSDDSSGLGQVTRVLGGQSSAVEPAPQQDQWQAAESAFGNHVVWSDIDRTKNPSPMELYVKDGDGPAMQLTDSHGGLNAFPSISENGQVISWLWVDPQNPNHARVYRFERD
jgi:Tol biopolymer transport system component